MGWKTLPFVFGMLFMLACSGSSSMENMPIDTVKPEITITSSGTLNASDAKRDREHLDGGRFVRLFVDPPTLDPHLTTDATSAQIIVEVFGGLVTIDSELNVVADLAESWDISPDGLVYTFRIRPDATFHDGKTVTAEDVRWSLERATDPLTEAPNVDQYLGDIVGVDAKLQGDALEISGVRVINEHTVEITIDESKSFFLAKMTYPTAFVLDQENIEANPKSWFREPNGTGPFKMSEYKVGETLVLSRHDGYHLGAAKLAEVEMILSGGTSMLMYENDEIDIAGVGLSDLDRLLDPTHSLNSELLQASPSFSIQYIGLNVDEPPLDDLNVRKALNLAIDKREIATIVLGDQVVPATGILPPGFPGFNSSVSGYEFNPEEAKRLLLASKYGDDLENMPPITITTPGSFGANVSLDMEVILAMWEKNLGIKTEFQQTEFATFLKDLHKGRFQMFDIGWIADYPDPENFLDILFYSDSSNNHTNYNNPDVDALLEQARIERDETMRFSIYNEVEQTILDDAPWIPLWYSGERYLLVKPNVHDFLQTPLIIPKLRHVYLTD
jgi:ABC-type transport system substrate-binding protein